MQIRPVGYNYTSQKAQNNSRPQNFGQVEFSSPQARSILIRQLKEIDPGLRQCFTNLIEACNTKGSRVIIGENASIYGAKSSYYEGAYFPVDYLDMLRESIVSPNIPEATKSLSQVLKECRIKE